MRRRTSPTGRSLHVVRATVRSSVVAIGVVASTVVATACTSDDDATPATTGAAAPSDAPTTTLPPEYAEFCAGMIELDERTDESSGLEAVDDVIATYTSLLPVTPQEIAADLAAVLERVQTERGGGELDEDAAAIADDAAARVSGWVDLNCHGVSNNPGPPPTPPP